MGKQAAVVLGALALVHISIILVGISLGTPYWLENEPLTNGSSDTSNNTQTTHKGFWQICVDSNCTRLNDTSQEEWFVSSKYMYTTATILCVLAVFGNYCFFACGRCQKSQFCNGLIFLVLVISGALQVAVLSEFGTNVHKKDDVDLGSAIMGWSFKVAIAAAVTTFLTSILHAVEQCYLRNRQDGYESI